MVYDGIKAWILKSKIYDPKYYKEIEKIFDILLKT